MEGAEENEEGEESYPSQSQRRKPAIHLTSKPLPPSQGQDSKCHPRAGLHSDCVPADDLTAKVLPPPPPPSLPSSSPAATAGWLSW